MHGLRETRKDVGSRCSARVDVTRDWLIAARLKYSGLVTALWNPWADVDKAYADVREEIRCARGAYAEALAAYSVASQRSY